MNQKFHLTTAIALLGLAGVSISRTEAALTVVNGDFQDITGLGSLGGGWYRGVPTGWAGRNGDYTVYSSGGNVIANLEQVSNTVGGFTPLYQDLGVLDSDSDVTLTFTVVQPWNANLAQAGAAIWANGSYSSTLSSQSNMAPGTYTLTASNVAAGTAIRIGFWRTQANNSPGLDNVSVNVVAVPEPSAVAVALPLVAGLMSVRRGRQKFSF